MRRTDWPERLAEFLKQNRMTPFQWGSHDCALFVCDAVMAMTGVDYGAEARGQYDSEAGAVQFLKAQTPGGTLPDYAAKLAEQNGLLEIPLLLAGRGDVVLWNHHIVGPSLGIVGLDGIYALFAAPKGLTRNRVRDCTKAWRIV